MVETRSTYRFCILERGTLNGYTVGRIERIDDVPDSPTPAPARARFRRAHSDSSDAWTLESLRIGLLIPYFTHIHVSRASSLMFRNFAAIRIRIFFLILIGKAMESS
jgi:hypothetical protein